MSLNLKRFLSVGFAFAIIFGIVALSPANAQQSDNVALNNLRANAKLHVPDDILADFDNGKPETAVIVVLQPSASANALAGQSRLSAQVPAGFDGPGAPAYYNLRDETVRSQLRTTATETADRVIGQLGATGMRVTQRFSYQFGFAAKVTPAALERIVNSPDVISVEKDDVLEPHLAQGIPLMNAAAVRNTYTGAGLSIAICDTGIDTSHPRLGGGGFPNSKVIGGYDTGDNDADPRPNTATGIPHGTACAGIAAGDTGTVGDYIGGVAPDAKLYALKITSGDTGSATDSAIIAAWEWAVTHKNDDPNNPIMVISTSFGGGGYVTTCDSQFSSLRTAAANAVAAGITIFASSGNNGYCDKVARPACISYVNSVGAVFDGALGTLGFCVSTASCATKEAYSACSTGFVSWDATAGDKVTSYSNSASYLTLFAPSNNAYTTDIAGAGGYSTDDYYTGFGGTSAACPYAAGSAAVLQQAAKAKTGAYLTPALVRTYLVNNGDNITDGKVAVTRPRVNLGRAVDALPLPGTVRFSAAAYSVGENGGSAVITVARTDGGNGAVGVSYATSDGTATAGSDYTATSGTLAWADGDTSAKNFSIPVTNDSNPNEANETVNLALQNPTGGAILGSPSTAVLTILQPFTVTATAVGGGSITPSSSEVVYGATLVLTLTPDSGYTLTGLTDNGAAVAAIEGPLGTFTYTITNISADHSISATFSQVQATSVPALGPWGILAAACGALSLAGIGKRQK